VSRVKVDIRYDAAFFAAQATVDDELGGVTYCPHCMGRTGPGLPPEGADPLDWCLPGHCDLARWKAKEATTDEAQEGVE